MTTDENPYLAIRGLVGWGPTSAANLFYRTRDHQREHFYSVVAFLPRDVHRLSLLDFGSGYGDFSAYIPAETNYLGVEANPTLVEKARRLYPNRHFLCSREIPPADVIVSVATVHCGVSDMGQTIRQLVRRARRLLVFTYTKGYAEPETVGKWCCGGWFTRGSVEIVESEHDFFTVAVQK